MLSLKSAVIGTVLTAFFGMTAAVVGCSAEGATTDDYVPTTEEKSPTEPGSSVKLPPKSEGANASSSSSSDGDEYANKPATDGGSTSTSGGPKGDASSSVTGDGGAPALAVGASCSTIDQKYKKICGKCGSTEAICVSTSNGTGGTVSSYGPCNGESTSATACVAGATEACGNCGVKTCSNTCGWSTCQSQGVCRKGQIQHDNAGCTVAGTYRTQTCTDTCGWSSFSACEEPVVIVPAVGDTSSTIWELKTSQLGKRPKSCAPRTVDLSPATVFPVALKNPTNAEVTVSIWNSTPVPVATATLDTAIYTYLRDTPPATDDEYKACYTESVDGCTALAGICAKDGGSEWAGVDNVKIPANSTLIVVTSGWEVTTKGKFVLNVKTK